MAMDYVPSAAVASRSPLFAELHRPSLRSRMRSLGTG